MGGNGLRARMSGRIGHAVEALPLDGGSPSEATNQVSREGA